MTLIAAVILVVAATTMFTLVVRAKDLPPPEPESPTRHLEERKAAIYDNLRDLQFEFRVGKLSDADYQQSKLGLQKELAGVLAEIDRIHQLHPQLAAHAPRAAVKSQEKAAANSAPAAVAETAHATGPASNGASQNAAVTECPHCGAKFSRAMRFCGECGKVMA
jgi:membrane protease subunit (stomatin/prohibitin family)